MKQYRKPLVALLAALLGLPAAFAQQPTPAPVVEPQPQPTETGTSDAVIITGSNIKRTDYEGPQSVLVYDAARIARTGARTVEEVLRRLPQNSGGFTDAVNTGLSFSPGASGVSLRGLGVSSTLVLLNGRRVAPFPLAQEGTDAFVDLNSIPIGAIERIEILKEGASAVYGSDAIAGVINVILKTNYQGAEIETYYGNTTEKDAAEVRESLTSGFSNEKFHMLLNANYYHRNPLADVDRGFAKSADKREFGGDDLRSVRSNPATLFFSSGGVSTPRRGFNGKTNSPSFNPIFDFEDGVLPDGNFRNRYNFNADSELISETERWGGLLTFGYNITPHIEFFGELGYQSVKSVTRIAPTPPDSAGDNIFVPTTNPYNVFGEDVFFLFRSLETGPRRDRVELDNYRYLGGFRIKDLPKNWSVETAFLYTESNVVDHSYAGFLSVDKVQKALNDSNPKTALNIFGDVSLGINNRKTLDGLIIKPRNDGIAYIYSEDFKASGELFNLPAGPVQLAIGGEYREEALSQKFSEPPGTIVGFGGAGSSGDRDVRSLFYEFAIPITSKKWNIPLVRALEFSIAERYDDYSDFGDTAKPKFGFKWKPLDAVLIRGAYSEGFRAPSLPQLFSGTISAFETVTNPVTGLTTDVPINTGGNPLLQPETSYSYFLGGIVEPPFIKGLTLGVDFYRIEQRNLIAQPDAQDIVNGTAPGTVTFDSTGQITNISALFANFGTVVVDGVDFDLTYKLETKIGTFTFEHVSAFINSYEQKIPGSVNEDLTDSFSLPEFKMVNSLYYAKGGFETGVTVNYTDSYDDIVYDPDLPTRKVGSWTTVDIQASYEWNYEPTEEAGYSKDGKTVAEARKVGPTGWRRWLNGTKVTVGCLNVGDSEPPFANIEEGYDTQTADPTGRFVYASVRKKFW